MAQDYAFERDDAGEGDRDGDEDVGDAEANVDDDMQPQKADQKRTFGGKGQQRAQFSKGGL